MRFRTRFAGLGWTALLWLALPVHLCGQQPPAAPPEDRPAEKDLAEFEQQVFRAAVARVAPSLVRIETVGGLERLGNVLFGTGPTTGLIVSDDGYLVSSAFNFAQKPSSIVVTLHDGTTLPARLVATDHSRMLVLLKVDPQRSLAVAEMLQEAQIQVGGWAIAVGRTFQGDTPNVSVGIVSAVKRIYGKAVQTDAKISPLNYGGPLIDARGRVIGVLAPLSPMHGGDVAGVEWYDSGIGFAVPLEQVLRALPRLKEGEDLHPGILGVGLKPGNEFAQPPVVAVCRPDSPAGKAGLKADDRIVEVDGRPIETVSQLKQNISNRYAGEELAVAVRRGEQRIEVRVTLAASLEPFRHAFLGILPLRAAQEKGIAVRFVYPEGPAAKAGLQPGDVITALDGAALEGAASLREAVNARAAEQVVRVEYRRDGQVRQTEVTLDVLPDAAPADLPPARAPRDPPEKRPEVGRLAPKVAEFENDCLAYVPENYHPEVPYGLVLWLHPAGGYQDDELLKLWQPLCNQYDLILLAPRSVGEGKWLPTEVPYLGKLIEQVQGTYHVDPARVVVHGYQEGGAMAYLAARAHLSLFRGAAVVEAAPPVPLREPDPVNRQAFFVAAAVEGDSFEPIKAAVDRLRQLRYPLAVKALGSQPRYLNADELQELMRWIDSLDRI